MRQASMMYIVKTHATGIETGTVILKYVWIELLIMIQVTCELMMTVAFSEIVSYWLITLWKYVFNISGSLCILLDW